MHNIRKVCSFQMNFLPGTLCFFRHKFEKSYITIRRRFQEILTAEKFSYRPSISRVFKKIKLASHVCDTLLAWGEIAIQFFHMALKGWCDAASWWSERPLFCIAVAVYCIGLHKWERSVVVRAMQFLRAVKFDCKTGAQHVLARGEIAIQFFHMALKG